MTEELANGTWTVQLKKLTAVQQQILLNSARSLLQYPDAVSDPLEAEAHVLVEQIQQNLAPRG